MLEPFQAASFGGHIAYILDSSCMYTKEHMMLKNYGIQLQLHSGNVKAFTVPKT